MQRFYAPVSPSSRPHAAIVPMRYAHELVHELVGRGIAIERWEAGYEPALAAETAFYLMGRMPGAEIDADEGFGLLSFHADERDVYRLLEEIMVGYQSSGLNASHPEMDERGRVRLPELELREDGLPLWAQAFVPADGWDLIFERHYGMSPTAFRRLAPVVALYTVLFCDAASGHSATTVAFDGKPGAEQIILGIPFCAGHNLRYQIRMDEERALFGLCQLQEDGLSVALPAPWELFEVEGSDRPGYGYPEFIHECDPGLDGLFYEMSSIVTAFREDRGAEPPTQGRPGERPGPGDGRARG